VLAARGPRDPLATVGRVGFGACLPLYGAVHFLYPRAVADFIPAWIPAHLFWAYLTACAFVAAGVAVLSGAGIRTATVLVAAMFTSWVVLLHIPRLLAALGDPHENGRPRSSRWRSPALHGSSPAGRPRGCDAVLAAGRYGSFAAGVGGHQSVTLSGTASNGGIRTSVSSL
jgi:uncharacterized membrane protein YphA (DoxX/SURF4 family)